MKKIGFLFFLILMVGMVWGDIIINEVDADTPGTDAVEFIELYDGGTGNTSLDGYVVVLFNGSDDVSYDAIDLDGKSTDANGYFVIGSSAVTNVDWAYFTTDGIQNGADAVALYTGDDTDFPNDTPVTTTNLVDAIVYDTDDADDAALLVLLNASEPQVNENGGGKKDTESMQRSPNGSGGARNTSSYVTATPTPGEPTVDLPDAPNAWINEIHYDNGGTEDLNEGVEVIIENSSSYNISDFVLYL